MGDGMNCGRPASGTIALGLALTLVLSGCVAAVLPALAVGVMVRGNSDQVVATTAADDAAQMVPPPPQPQPQPQPLREPIFPVTTALIPPPPVLAATPSAAEPALVATRFQFDPTYGAFVSHVEGWARLVAEGAPVASLVVANGLLVRQPEYVRCSNQRPAVVIDLDDGAPDAQTARSPADAAAADPQLVAAIDAVRTFGVDVLWITDQASDSRTAIAERLRSSGLDQVGSDAILTSGGAGDRKQLRRFRAAQSHCIIAVVGDRRSDADEAYDYLRDPTTPLVIDANWNAGWFILPAPLRQLAAATPNQEDGNQEDGNALDPR